MNTKIMDYMARSSLLIGGIGFMAMSSMTKGAWEAILACISVAALLGYQFTMERFLRG